MGGFDRHLGAGIVAGLVVAAAGWHALASRGYAGSRLLTITAVLFCIVVVASLLPDLDVHSSIPRQWLGVVLLVGGIATPFYLALERPALVRSVGENVASAVGLGNVPLEYLGLLAVLGVGIVGATAIGVAFDELTDHRGFFHSIFFAVLVGGVVWYGGVQSGWVDGGIALGLGVAGLLGVLVHTHVVDR